jgi:hypothetical protein
MDTLKNGMATERSNRDVRPKVPYVTYWFTLAEMEF